MWRVFMNSWPKPRWIIATNIRFRQLHHAKGFICNFHRIKAKQNGRMTAGGGMSERKVFRSRIAHKWKPDKETEL